MGYSFIYIDMTEHFFKKNETVKLCIHLAVEVLVELEEMMLGQHEVIRFFGLMIAHTEENYLFFIQQSNLVSLQITQII